MIAIRNNEGLAISHSSNLAGLRRHCGKVRCTRISVRSIGISGTCDVMFIFSDRTTCQMTWSSIVVLAESLRRWRNVYTAELFVDSTDCGKIEFHNEWINRTARF